MEHFAKINGSVIGQKGESQNGDNKKTKHVKDSEKTHISYLLIRTRNLILQKGLREQNDISIIHQIIMYEDR